MKVITEYLDKLRPNITKLNLSCRGISKLPEDCLLRFTQLRDINLRYNYLKVLPKLPPTVENLWCDSNLLKTLDLRQYPNLRLIDCKINKLRKLLLPSSCETLYCGYNIISCYDLDTYNEYVKRWHHDFLAFPASERAMAIACFLFLTTPPEPE